MFFLPPRNGLELAGDALLEAIKILRQPEDVEEPIKAENRENMYLDQDRQNVTGSPALADTITRARRARSRRTSVGTRCSRTTAFRAIEAGAWIPLPLAARLGFRIAANISFAV